VARLGIITPSSNTVLEPQTMRLLQPVADRVTVHFSRFRVTAIADNPEAHEQFAIGPMLEAASLLADAHVEAILWSGTSGAWEGLDADRLLVDRIGASTGVRATSSSLALLEAFQTLGAHTYGLVVPYVEPIAAAIVRNLEGAGYLCKARTNESLSVNNEFATLSPALISARVREVARTTPDVIVIHCTNLRGAEVAEQLEDELGIPVIDSVVVGLWGVLQLLEIPMPKIGFGRLGKAPTQGVAW
jgi:maleate isomerase